LNKQKKMCLLTTNEHISKAFYSFNMGQKFIQKNFSAKWLLSDIVTKLTEYSTQNLAEIYSLKDKLLEKNLDYKILCLDNKRFVFYPLTKRLENLKLTFFPIFYTNQLYFNYDPNDKLLKNTFDFFYDFKKMVVRTDPGDWVILKFGTYNLFTSEMFFENCNSYTLGGVKLEAALKNNTIYNAMLKQDLKLTLTEIRNSLAPQEINVPDYKYDLIFLNNFADNFKQREIFNRCFKKRFSEEFPKMERNNKEDEKENVKGKQKEKEKGKERGEKYEEGQDIGINLNFLERNVNEKDEEQTDTDTSNGEFQMQYINEEEVSLRPQIFIKNEEETKNEDEEPEIDIDFEEEETFFY